MTKSIRSTHRKGAQKSAPLEIIYQPVDALKPDPRNPRVHTRDQIRAIALSIESYGFLVPLLVRNQNELIAGHGRWLAAKEQGLREVPTIRIEHLTEAQIRAFMIADNRLTEIATWDDKLLAEQLNELSLVNLDFSLEATGFTMGEIDFRIQGLSAEVEGKDDPADTLPPAGQPVSQAGYLWLLGRHRLICGSAVEDAPYSTLMDGGRAAMVITDPPYNVPIEGHASGLGATHHREFVMASGEMDAAEFTAFLTRACSLLACHSADGALNFIFMDWRHLDEILAAGRAAYSGLKNLCVWKKSNAGMGSLYRSRHELIFVFKNGNASHRNNVSLGRYGRYRTNVWEYPPISQFGRGSEEGNLLALHPTVKPVAMVADAIMDCTARGDVVLDAFLGSGTTMIAAERVGRRCYGMEIDPIYVDTAVRRWQAYSGEKAWHAASGRSFDELEAAAEAAHAG